MIVEYELIENTSKIYYNGSKWQSNNCGEFAIIGKTDRSRLEKNGYEHHDHYLCQFNDETKVVAVSNHIKGGKVKNPNHPNVYGVGYFGQGEWESRDLDNMTKEYNAWIRMLQRCYDEKLQEKEPTYKGVTVDIRWHNFQVFCEDIQHLEGYQDWKTSNTLELDKDILCESLNISPKIYSKNTCLFITKKENRYHRNKESILTGLTYVAHRIKDGYEEEFVHQTEFAKKWDLIKQGVYNCIKGKAKKHKGWTFKVKELLN